jgi:benzoylformate decarboxylase
MHPAGKPPFGFKTREVGMRTVREAAYDVLISRGVRRIYGNPGSTEVSFLADMPPEIDFVLGLHEGSVVGMATGDALITGSAAVVLLHTTAGLGNAVGAIATARVNRAPLVIVVGQQDRRHIISEPFLTGRLVGLSGDYPIAVHEPAQAQDLPSLLARAFLDAEVGQGPVLVIAPMDDWEAAMPVDAAIVSPTIVVAPERQEVELPSQVLDACDAASSPVLVLGSRITTQHEWNLVAQLAEALDCPVWQESHSARAGIDQRSPRFAGHLPAHRAALRDALSQHDLVIIVGGLAFRQYLFAEGPFVSPGTQVMVINDSLDETARSQANIAFLAPLSAALDSLVSQVKPRQHGASIERRKTAVSTSARDGVLHPTEIFEAIARRNIANLTLIEESPSTRSELINMVPVSDPLGFFTPAMGGLGFALPAATGMALARPDRTVIAVVGDGAAMYNIQALWSAQTYDANAIFIIMDNGRYAVMDRLAKMRDAKPAWPAFDDISVVGLAESFGCKAVQITSLEQFDAALDAALLQRGKPGSPLVLDVVVDAT